VDEQLGNFEQVSPCFVCCVTTFGNMLIHASMSRTVMEVRTNGKKKSMAMTTDLKMISWEDRSTDEIKSG